MNNYILDTSVIIDNPHSIYSFPNQNVIIPLATQDELDKQKNHSDYRGVNSREFFRQYLKLREKEKDEYGRIKLDNGGTFRIELNHIHQAKVREIFTEMDNDRRILSVAVNLAQESENDDKYYVVSSDYGFIAEADTVKSNLNIDNLEVLFYNQEFQFDSQDSVYTGKKEVTVPNELMMNLRKSKVPYDLFLTKANINEKDNDIQIGQFLVCVNESNPKDVIFTRLVMENDALYVRRIIEYDPMKTKGIMARENNVEQKMLMDLLMDKKTELVTVIGKAGSGKTLMSLASAMSQIESESSYRKLIVTRPMISMGKDPGAFTGDEDNKIRPWMRSIFDNLEIIKNNGSDKDKDPDKQSDEVLDGLDYMEISMLQLIRGRTLPNTLIFVDEAQNLTIHEARTIITRAGEGSKIILAGDPEQIDHPYLDSTNNGLVFVTERMKGADLFGSITLEKSERSRLTEIATKRLK